MKRNMLVLHGMLATLPLYAATPLVLEHQSAFMLKTPSLVASELNMSEISRANDHNNTLHVRVQQTFEGYPIFGADSVIHIPGAGRSKKSYNSLLSKNSSMNGTVWLNLYKDLRQAPDRIFAEETLNEAVKNAVQRYQKQKNFQIQPTDEQGQLMVFIDKNNQARWVFEISFMVRQSPTHMPEKPVYLLDALTGEVYEQWNDIKTLEKVKAGGFGGNHKTGHKIFDGGENNLPGFDIDRNAELNMCYFKNDHVTVLDSNTWDPMRFKCEELNPEHNFIYWSGNFDQVQTTSSPTNDVMFGAEITRKMFNDWYNMPMLVQKNGKPMHLSAFVHDPIENAYWQNNSVTFGNSEGSHYFNPFTQLDTVAHEICHGFTEQHSNLVYKKQSGGLNEAFSDICGIAAEYYAYGKTDFLVGWGDMLKEGVAMRYMDQPSKDCEGGRPGMGCSIDVMNQYYEGLNVHYSSGIFNRVYYNLANMPGWNPQKAFDIMVQANAHYWTKTSTFAQAACSVMKATKDFHYETADVAEAFNVVGIDVNKVC